VGPYTFTFLGFEVPDAHSAGSADVGAKLEVTYQGETVKLTPKITLLANATNPEEAIKDSPVTLAGGHSASLAAFDPMQRRVLIRVHDLGLPVDPAKAVVTVSLKPGVSLVWLGVCLGVIGGLIAVLRRTLEGRADVLGRRFPLGRKLRAPGPLREAAPPAGGNE
jgi:cytochrome c-type biogenesis protein CcmF